MSADRPAVPSGHCCSNDGSPIDAICTKVTERLDELQPYLDEAERLRAVLGAAGCGASTDETPTPEPRPREVPAGHNKQLIAQQLTEHPDSSAAEIARRVGAKRTVIASTMSRMARHGELERTTDGYRLPRTTRPSPNTTTPKTPR